MHKIVHTTCAAFLQYCREHESDGMDVADSRLGAGILYTRVHTEISKGGVLVHLPQAREFRRTMWLHHDGGTHA